MPTEYYHTIASAKPVPRGKKGLAFPIPSKLVNGPGKDTVITIQMAFICPDWTLVFADHQVMITFHVMLLKELCCAQDFATDSKVSLAILMSAAPSDDKQ